RMPPGWIIRGMRKRLGIKLQSETFRNPAQARRALDRKLDEGELVGLQTGVFWLPYFPEEMRFHFNAHNLIVYGTEHDDYLISDPVFEYPSRCASDALERARFAKGALAPKGMMYSIETIPQDVDFSVAIKGAVRANFRTMTKAPLPVIGVRGIRHLAKNVEALGRAGDARKLRLYLAHIVRMQEEIGTGGAGFRFIYASFLQESARLLNNTTLREASAALTEAGDQWRMFALRASKMCRDRETMNVTVLGDLLRDCADREQVMWQGLRDI